MNEKITILIVYNDNVILVKNDETKIGQLKTLLIMEFEIKDVSPLWYFLGT